MVDVLIPWRGGCHHRQAALDWLQHRFASAHPTWRVILGHGSPGPWVKAEAVADAVSRSDADVLIVHDADVWCDGLTEAVQALHTYPWAIPHRQVHRLDETATRRVLAGHQPTRDDPCTQPPYRGRPGGGIVVLPRDTYLATPLDGCFQGWGQEDDAHALALTVLYGKPWRGTHPLWHLWHPPQDRESRVVGNPEGLARYRRYRAAIKSREAMRALVAEGAEHVRAIRAPVLPSPPS